MTPEELSLRGRLGAHSRWANVTDRTAATAKTRAAADDRFIRKARAEHPDASDDQIRQMAESLRKAFYTSMAYRSAQARKAKSRPPSRPDPKILQAESLAKAEAARVALAESQAGA